MIKSIFIYITNLFAIYLPSYALTPDKPEKTGFEQHAYWTCPGRDINDIANHYANKWAPIFSSLKADGLVKDFGAGFDATAQHATGSDSAAQTPAIVDYQWFIWYQLTSHEHGADFWVIFAERAETAQIGPATPFEKCPSALLVSYKY